MTREEYLAIAKKNLEIVFYVRDGMNGNPELVHDIISKMPDKVFMDLNNEYAPAELLIQEEYFSCEGVDDLAIECKRAFFITERELEVRNDKSKTFKLD